ncbi:hypothetical protein [Dryocola sp. BD626]|uniref:hypothetical protein n=1 Tax=Dryocola sp. BD626 TaxID=3133273 RepID=UPI003F5059BC
MSEFKGTPGPWSEDKYGQCIDSKGESVKFSGLTLAGRAKDEYLANDKLVIAAPDLLGALQEIVFLYEHDEGCRELTEYKRAKAAISKATGGCNEA